MSPTTYADVLARNIRAARARAGLGQEATAARMRALGFDFWVRQTVGSTEKPSRRVSAEEIVGLAFALGTTVQRLMTPIGEDKWVELPSGMHLDVSAIVHLVEGRNDGQLQWYDATPYQTGASAAALEFEAVWPGGPRPIAAAVVISDRGVLVGRRNDGTPPWTFIAGEVEPGEQPEIAAEREVKEEASIEVAVGEVIGKRVHPQTRRFMIYLAARPTEGTDIYVGDRAELAEVRWASMAEADELLPGMFEPVRDYLSRELGRKAR